MIETKRTILRPMKQEDAEAVFNYRSDSKTNQFLLQYKARLKN